MKKWNIQQGCEVNEVLSGQTIQGISSDLAR